MRSRILTTDQVFRLARMLEYCRPYGSPMDEAFCAAYIATLPGATQDPHGNWIVNVGTSDVLWSCHTDTVHHTPRMQRVHVDLDASIIRLSRKSRRSSACLGADDTVGVFLCRELIMAGVPGRYIFHYGEESGCIGSGDLAHYAPETLDGIRFAIALDRAGTSDIITSQMGTTCASVPFAVSLARQLSPHLQMRAARGVFTDTAEYMDLVPECTNLSVGYYDQHSPREYVDYAHVGTLLFALSQMDQSQLVCARDPFAKPERSAWTLKSFDPSVRDYSSSIGDLRGSGITKIDGHTSATLWRESYGWTEWCLKCDAPILPSDDPDLDDVDHCVCHVEDEDVETELSLDDTRGLSDEDVRFLKYLRGLD